MIRIPSNPNNILIVESYLRKLNLNTIINSEKFADILISLTEAVNNAIIHGNKADETKFVNIHVLSQGNGIIFKVSDEGTGFNHCYVPDPTKPENVECCGGRGVYIMKALADKISFHDDGRTVEMFFKFQQQTA